MKFIRSAKKDSIKMEAAQLTQIIDQILSDEVAHIVETTSAIVDPRGKNGKALKKIYTSSTKNIRAHNYNIEYAQSHIPVESKEIQSFRDFAINKLVRQSNDIKYFATFDHETNEWKIPDENRFIEHDSEYIGHTADMQELRRQTLQLEALLISGDNNKAKKHLDCIISDFGSQVEIQEPIIKTSLEESQINELVTGAPTFSSQIDLYIDQLKIKKPLEYRNYLEFFEFSIGTKPVNKVKWRELDSICTKYANTPKSQFQNRTDSDIKYPYKGYSLKERIDVELSDDIVNPIFLPSSNTLKSLLKVIKDYFKFLIESESNLIEISPVLSMTFDPKKESKNKGYKRFKFSKNQTTKILSHSIIDLDNQHNMVILIMAFTGARNTEILQLRDEDIFKEEDSGIWCFRITNDAGSVKTEASNRFIPIHSKLLELGVINLKDNASEGKVFHTINKDSLGLHYREVRSLLSIPSLTPDGKLLDLYSWRHTVRSALSAAKVVDAVKNSITGHVGKGTGESVYSHLDEDNVKLLKLEIDKIQYDL